MADGWIRKERNKTTHNVIHLGHKFNDMDKMFHNISGGKKRRQSDLTVFGETSFRIVYWGNALRVDGYTLLKVRWPRQKWSNSNEGRRCKVGRKDG